VVEGPVTNRGTRGPGGEQLITVNGERLTTSQVFVAGWRRGSALVS
jgi:hypothetical protein